MPGIIFRYILRNFLQFFCGVLFVFVFVIFMAQFSRIFTYAVNYGADMFWVMSMTVYLLPDILALSLPMAFQIGLLMTLTAMSQSGEIMALRAAGFSFGEIARPLLFVALALVCFMFYLTGWLNPQSRNYLEESKDDIANKISKISIEPKTFINIGDWDLFAEAVDKKNNTLGGVHLSRRNDTTAFSTKINAAQGKINIGRAGITMTLYRGQMQRLDARAERRIITAEFATYAIFIPLSQKTASARVPKGAELTSPQIITALRSGNLPEADAKTYRSEPAYRVSLSLAALIFFLLGCPVAFITDKKAGRGAAMLFSIVFIFGYFGLLTLGDILGRQFAFSAAFAPLLPAFVGAAFGAWLWRKKLSD